MRQGIVALLDQVLQDLLVLQRVHRPPEAFMPECHELVGLDQPLERRLDQFVAFPYVVENLLPEDKVATIDPEICIVAGANASNLSRSAAYRPDAG